MPLPTLVRVSSSPLWLLLTLIGLTLLMHLLFVRIWPLKDVTWKYADYVWLFAASIGVLASSGAAKHYVAAAQIRLQEPVIQNSYTLLRDAISNLVPISCAERQRTSWSPPNFDEILQAQKLVCEQYKRLDLEMPKSVEPPFKSLTELGFQRITGDKRYVKFEVERLDREVAFYENNRLAYQQTREEENISDWERTNFIVGPLLLAFAMAVRLAKTSGEIRNAKSKG